MVDNETIEALELLIVRSGAITTRALAEVHPEIVALTVSQYRVLALLASAEDGLRVTELARQGRTPVSAVGRLVFRLEDKGLLWSERGTMPDRRAVVVRLTDQGRITWAEITDRRRQLLKEAIEGVPMPPGIADAFEAISEAFEQFTAS